jgi:hypothetical protein
MMSALSNVAGVNRFVIPREKEVRTILNPKSLTALVGYPLFSE